MTAMFNFLWMLLGGAAAALLWLLLGGLFFLLPGGAPIGRGCLQLALFAAAPFEKKLARRQCLEGSDDLPGWEDIPKTTRLLWRIAAVPALLLCWLGGVLSLLSLIGISVGRVYLGAAPFILSPPGTLRVPRSQAKSCCCG